MKKTPELLNVLQLDNTISFTPDANYEPATKKYVDDLTGIDTFIELTDCPNAYTGAGSKFAKVKATEDGLEFASIPGGDMLKSTYDPNEDGIIAVAQLDASLLTTSHEEAATGIHGVTSNYVAQAPAASHLVRTFTKGWTSGKLVKGAGVDANPTEIDVPAYNFLELSDTPSTYSGLRGKFPIINPDENALIFESDMVLVGGATRITVKGGL